MKKRLFRLSVGLLLLSCLMLSGCANSAKDAASPALTLTPAELSADAQMLAGALGYQGDVQIFNYQLTGAEADRSQSLTLEVWRYEEGRWLKQVGTMLELLQEDRILLVNSDEGFWCIAGDQLGRTGGYYCATDIWQRDADWESWFNMKISRELTLEPGEECFLRAMYGPAQEAADINEETLKDFREDLAIDGCVVLTATFNAAEL